MRLTSPVTRQKAELKLQPLVQPLCSGQEWGYRSWHRFVTPTVPADGKLAGFEGLGRKQTPCLSSELCQHDPHHETILSEPLYRCLTVKRL